MLCVFMRIKRYLIFDKILNSCSNYRREKARKKKKKKFRNKIRSQILFVIGSNPLLSLTDWTFIESDSDSSFPRPSRFAVTGTRGPICKLVTKVCMLCVWKGTLSAQTFRFHIARQTENIRGRESRPQDGAEIGVPFWREKKVWVNLSISILFYLWFAVVRLFERNKNLGNKNFSIIWPFTLW